MTLLIPTCGKLTVTNLCILQQVLTLLHSCSEHLCVHPLVESSTNQLHDHQPDGDTDSAWCLPPQGGNSTAKVCSAGHSSPNLPPYSTSMTKQCYRTLRPLTADPSDFTLHDRRNSTYMPPPLPDYQTPCPQGATEMNQADPSPSPLSSPRVLGEVSLVVLDDSLEDADCLGAEHRDNSNLTSGGWCLSHDTEACFSQVNMAWSSEEEEWNLGSIKRKREDFRLSLWDTSSDSGTEQ